jgi:hypothetical protein
VDQLFGNTNETKIKSQRSIHRTHLKYLNLRTNNCRTAKEKLKECRISIESPFLDREQGKCAARA